MSANVVEINKNPVNTYYVAKLLRKKQKFFFWNNLKLTTSRNIHLNVLEICYSTESFEKTQHQNRSADLNIVIILENMERNLATGSRYATVRPLISYTGVFSSKVFVLFGGVACTKPNHRKETLFFRRLEIKQTRFRDKGYIGPYLSVPVTTDGSSV